ncbi:MAG: signal protein PDZ, partial [Firmicutes bacterium]|nr:signal protein PDZ [Bacillota bacterium]
PVLPVDITIEVGEISGPSAGLMFVLEIINQLDPRDLTAGQKIAGTGTINLQEEVGSIGGVRQKVKAAEEAGATYFISPLDNYEDAKAAANSITVVQVNTLDEVLIFLEDLMQK